MKPGPLNENTFQLLVASVKEYAIFMLDPAGHIVSWNAGAERINGYKADEVIGRHFSIFYIAADLKDNKPARELEVARTQGQYQEEGWRVRKGGSRFWSSVLITAVRGPGGELHGFAKVTRDMTEKMLAEQNLRAANERLRASNSELEMFASVASHDLQEPLRKIQAFGDQLATGYADKLGEEGAFYVERMQDAALRMSTLIDDLLTYSRVSSKGRALVPVDLGKIAIEVLDDLETRIKSVNGQVEVGELPVVEADPLQMRQLLQNLIGNALKFHRPGRPPHVRVSARRLETDKASTVPGGSRPQIEIRVKDDGIGFEEEYREKIFGLFQRLHGRGEFEGTGLGLAICRKIVDRHGGHIEAHGRPGEGAEVIVTLPAPSNGAESHGAS
jgi:PAS domain S-box-containing protein